MDFQELKALIESNIQEVFDTMLALEIVPQEAWPSEKQTDDLVVGKTAFSGALSGCIQFWLSYSLGTIITAAMLGMEPEDIEDEDSVSDVLMEVLNIVSGNLKTNLTNSGVAIDFDAPRILMEGTDATLPETIDEESVQFALVHDNHPILVQIAPVRSTQKPPPQKAATAEPVEDAEQGAPLSTEDIMASLAESPEPETGNETEEETQAEPPEEPPALPSDPDAPLTTEQIAALMAQSNDSESEETPDTASAPQTHSESSPVAEDTSPKEAPDHKEKFDVSYNPAEEETLESQLKLKKIVEALNEDLEEDKEVPAEEETVQEAPQLQVDQLDLIMDIPIQLTAELGRTRMRIEELLKLGPGASVILAELENEPITILANNTPIARGTVVVENEKYGIRITELTSRKDRLKSLT